MAPPSSTARLIIGVFKIVTGFSGLASGLFFLLVSGDRLRRLAYWLEGQYAQWSPELGEAVREMTLTLHDERWYYGPLLAFFGGAQIAAAIFFLLRKPWGYWTLLAVCIAVLPFEIWKVLGSEGTKAPLSETLILLVDLGIVGYLLLRRQALTARPASGDSGDGEGDVSR
jgi:hypothetical protein